MQKEPGVMGKGRRVWCLWEKWEVLERSVTMEIMQNFEALLPNHWICNVSLGASQEPHEKAIQLIWDKLLASAKLYGVLQVAIGRGLWLHLTDEGSRFRRGKSTVQGCNTSWYCRIWHIPGWPWVCFVHEELLSPLWHFPSAESIGVCHHTWLTWCCR